MLLSRMIFAAALLSAASATCLARTAGSSSASGGIGAPLGTAPSGQTTSPFMCPNGAIAC